MQMGSLDPVHAEARIRAYLSGIRTVLPGLRLVAPLFMLAAVSFLFCMYISRQPSFVGSQTNADNLLAVSYIWDLQHHDYALFGFQLPRIPSIFPDLTIQAAAVAVSPSYRWSLFVYAWIQSVLFTLAAAYIVALLSGAPPYRAITVSGVLISLVVLADSRLAGGTHITYNYYMACIHFGPFVVALIASALAFRLLHDWHYGIAVLFFALSTLSILSNKLLLPAFAIPVSIAALASVVTLMPAGKPRALRLVAIIGASVLAASILDEGIYRQPDIKIEWSQALTRLHSFLSEGFVFVGDHLIAIILCILLPMSVFVGYALVALNSARGRIRNQTWLRTDLAKVFFWLNAASAMAGVAAAVALLAYADYGSYRYLAPVMTWPIIFTIAAVVVSPIARKMTYVVGAGIIALCATDIVSRGNIVPGTVSWRSPVADCILVNKERFGLQAGIAEYWISRPAMFSSNWSLQVNQATGDGHPYIWGNNKYWYIKSFDNKSGSPIYNFVVMERMDPSGITKRFGHPSRRIECPTGQEIWVYDDARRMTERFLKPLVPRDGHYRDSCVDMLQVGSRLSAKCRRRDGDWKWTSLRTSRCGSGDIVNRDGTLRC